MKKLGLALAAVVGAFMLTSCQSTSSSPAPAAATSTCVGVNSMGQPVNSLGQICTSTTGTCSSEGLVYNGSYWYNPAQPGVPVSCSVSGVTTTGSSSGLGGCTYWDSVYPGTDYIPMIDPTTGNLVCINISSYGISSSQLSEYGYNPYSTPVYASSCPYTPYNDPNWYNDCYSGWQYSGNYYGYNNYGYNSGGSSSGICFGVGAGDGSDYGYGDGFFGICL